MMPDDHTQLAMDDVVQLVPLESGARPVPFRPAPFRPAPRRRGWVRMLLLVVLPTALCGTYLFGFAAPRYISEARFSISRSNQMGRMPGAALSIDEAPKGLGEDDSYAVRDFLQSRDALRLALVNSDLRDMLRAATSDPLWAFPGWLRGRSNEDLYRYLQWLVSVDYDSSTGITILRVQGFAPQDAQRLADVLLAGSEALVNRLNERARSDAIRVAAAEVERAQADAVHAEDRLTAFRNRWSVIDPSALSQTVIAAITALTLQSAEAAAQLDVLVHSQVRSPQIAPLRARITALQAQIELERARLAGSDASLAPRIAEYERLLLLRDFAARSYVSALTVLESVRLDAQRQQAYLTRIVLPQQADEPASPRPATWTLAVLLCGVLMFALFRPEPPG